MALAGEGKVIAIGTLGTLVSLELVAIGIKATCNDPRKTCVLQQSKAWIAGQATSCFTIIGVAVGVHWLADIVRVQIVSHRAGCTYAFTVIGFTS